MALRNEYKAITKQIDVMETAKANGAMVSEKRLAGRKETAEQIKKEINGIESTRNAEKKIGEFLGEMLFPQ